MSRTILQIKIVVQSKTMAVTQQQQKYLLTFAAAIGNISFHIFLQREMFFKSSYANIANILLMAFYMP